MFLSTPYHLSTKQSKRPWSYCMGNTQGGPSSRWASVSSWDPYQSWQVRQVSVQQLPLPLELPPSLFPASTVHHSGQDFSRTVPQKGASGIKRWTKPSKKEHSAYHKHAWLRFSRNSGCQRLLSSSMPAIIYRTEFCRCAVPRWSIHGVTLRQPSDLQEDFRKVVAMLWPTLQAGGMKSSKTRRRRS